MLEIEKTFLVKKIPTDLAKFESFKIKQGYISTDDSVIRVRSKGNKFELTKKWRINPSDHRRQEEINVSLTEGEFKKLWQLVDKFVEKTRYLIPLDKGLTAELDIFEGLMEGHAVVEVEFKNEREMDSFKKPDWFGEDISQDDVGSSNFLSGKSFEQIKSLLSARS